MQLNIFYFFIMDLQSIFTLTAGKSTAGSEEIAQKEKEYHERVEKLAEDVEEHKKIDEENSYLGDIDSPKEAESAKELEEWDNHIEHEKDSILDLILWLLN
jgi:hypothetical protein